MTRKLAPKTASLPDWAQFDSVGGDNPVLVLAGRGRQVLVTVAETAALLKVSEKTTRRLVARGDVKAVRIGRSVRIHFSELENLIAGGGARARDSGEGKDHD